ncbi:MAG: glucosamine-6-phosphate deaminase [Candidatus Devosia euplotis]|nr:glucosamine-6-phosphate deaminase [Candidatus Devosia euplotis]
MLAALACVESVDWTRVEAFHMDEYIGLAEDAPQRFGNWLGRHFFDLVPPYKAHRIMPGSDPASTALDYAEMLAEAPVEIIQLGIGVNGRIAFNDPPVKRFDNPLMVKMVELDAVCRQQQVDDDCFERFKDVPSHAITLTVPQLMAGQRLFCMVPGSASGRPSRRRSMVRSPPNARPRSCASTLPAPFI